GVSSSRLGFGRVAVLGGAARVGSWRPQAGQNRERGCTGVLQNGQVRFMRVFAIDAFRPAPRAALVRDRHSLPWIWTRGAPKMFRLYIAAPIAEETDRRVMSIRLFCHPCGFLVRLWADATQCSPPRFHFSI